MKKKRTVPPREEHLVDGKWYRAGDVYEYEVEIKEKKSKIKESDNAESTNES